MRAERRAQSLRAPRWPWRTWAAGRSLTLANCPRWPIRRQVRRENHQTSFPPWYEQAGNNCTPHIDSREGPGNQRRFKERSVRGYQGDCRFSAQLRDLSSGQPRRQAMDEVCGSARCVRDSHPEVAPSCTRQRRPPTLPPGGHGLALRAAEAVSERRAGHAWFVADVRVKTFVQEAADRLGS